MGETTERERFLAQRRRELRADARSWWRDGLEGAVYLVSAAGIALVIATGGAIFSEPADVFYFLGRCLGVVGTVFALAQVLLVSRAPYIEQSVGHDRTVALHARLGKWAIILMIGHMASVVGISAGWEDRTFIGQAAEYFTAAWYLALAQIALVLFLVVLATSLAIVRGRWRYETWHLVHLLVYVAVGAAVPHQFLFGTTFTTSDLAWWFWLALYVVAFGSLLAFRVVRPLVRERRHALRVVEVIPDPAGVTHLVISGRRVDEFRAAPGQFFLWRFLAPGLWREAHPFSLSAATGRSALRISVKAAGDFTRRLAEVKPGTRVLAEGPLGVFTGERRWHEGSVLVAAGIGITPVRAMLETVAGPCDVIVRVRSEEEAPLLAEVRQWAQVVGARVHLVVGPRGAGWSSALRPVSLAQIVPDVAERDVFICGPADWADAVEADALASGCRPYAIHRERFGW